MWNIFNHLLACLCCADLLFLLANLLIHPVHLGIENSFTRFILLFCLDLFSCQIISFPTQFVDIWQFVKYLSHISVLEHLVYLVACRNVKWRQSSVRDLFPGTRFLCWKVFAILPTLPGATYLLVYSTLPTSLCPLKAFLWITRRSKSHTAKFILTSKFVMDKDKNLMNWAHKP